MHRSIALIPARSGSKRIKDKNTLRLNGHPLMAYTIRSAIDSKIFDRVICVTDSLKYLKIAKKYGAEVPYLRPKEISGDKSPDIKWVKWMMKKLNKNNKYDIFSILRPTNPLRDEKVIKRAYKKFFQKKNCDSLRAVDLCKQHPFKMWKLKGKYMVPLIKSQKKIPFHSRQYAQLPKIYTQNASIEIAWTKVLKNKNPSISGKKIIPYFSKGFDGFDINQPEDIFLLKYLIKKKIVKLKRF